MVTEIQRQLEQRAAGGPNALVERLAQSLGGKAGAAAVFGEPVERNGATVIPVAKVRWGFGGGGGESPGSTESPAGSGSGGGGVSAKPLGYIEIRDGETTFRPIGDHAAALQSVALLVLASGVAATMIIGGLRRIIRK